MASSKPDPSIPPKSSISILVHPNDLRGASHNPLKKNNWFKRRQHFRCWNRVSVESTPSALADNVFYAPDQYYSQGTNHNTPTDFINTRSDGPNIVRKGDFFEMAFVGMSATPQDVLSNNELLLYSLTNALEGPHAKWAQLVDEETTWTLENTKTKPAQIPSDSMRKIDSTITSRTVSTGGRSPTAKDVPFIHYDPTADGRDVGSEPNSFISIPASKAVYKQIHPASNKLDMCAHVNVRFSVMDIDRISTAQIQAISSLTQLGEFVKKGSVALPFMELVSTAFDAVGGLSQVAIKHYSKADNVIWKDMMFRLAEPLVNGLVGCASESSISQSCGVNTGSYLRYGYYFFLAENVDAKLYAQTHASSNNVRLMLKRTDYNGRQKRCNELEYIPLSGVSYVVMKVSSYCTELNEGARVALAKEHKQRIETLAHVSNIMGRFDNQPQTRNPFDATTRLVKKATGSWRGRRK